MARLSPGQSTDCECEWMRWSGSAFGPLCERHRAILCAIAFMLICGAPARGQDVAEAARQEKARKAAEQKSPRHVYTEEDLQKQVILTTEDQARVEARKRQQPVTPGAENAKQLPNDGQPSTESLGEIARRYRQQKAEHQDELATKKKFTPFSYQVSGDSLAEPRVETAPLNGSGMGMAPYSRTNPPVPNLAPRSSPHVNTPHKRLSPFQPRLFSELPVAPPADLAALPPAPVRPPSVATRVERRTAPATLAKGMRRIEVQQGQSWWKLAQMYLGSGARWPELRNLNANAGGPPELLELGSIVVVPEVAKAPQRSTRGAIKVQKGDSLWSLAQTYLGRGDAWGCLASLNPQIVDYMHLAVGTPVQLPEGDALSSCCADELKKK